MANTFIRFTEEGRPCTPTAMFVGIKRVQLPTLLQLFECLNSNQKVRVDRIKWLTPVYSKDAHLEGSIAQLRLFSDGALVVFSNMSKDSLLENWETADLWISYTGQSGILCRWASNKNGARN